MGGYFSSSFFGNSQPQQIAGTVYVITVPVTDNLGNPLQGISLVLVDGQFRYPAVTNSSGQATFNRSNGTYTVLVHDSLYGDGTATVTVDGADITATAIVLTPVVNPPAPISGRVLID